MSRKGSKSNFPELKSMKRLSKFPVVQQSVSCLNNFYEKAKEHNVERIHGVLVMASSIAKGVVFKVTNVLGKPIKVVDSILDKSLCFVELKIPAVHDPPNKLHEGFKNYIYTFWGGEMAYTMVERVAATFRHLMEIIFISSLDENITMVRTLNEKSNSSIVKFVYSSVEVTLVTFGFVPVFLGRLFPAEPTSEVTENSTGSSSSSSCGRNGNEENEGNVNSSEQVGSGNASPVSKSMGADKTDSPNHSKSQQKLD